MEHKRYRVRWKHKDADEWRYGHGTMNYANAKDWADEMNRKSLYFIHEIVEVPGGQDE